MKILSLDASATSASVCVYDASASKIIGEFFINTKLTHSQTLVPMIDALLSSTKLELSDIDYFAVNTGPGSFTGIRIGVSVVKGMAMALSKPCVSVSTLESMAYNFIDLNDTVVCSCMDARRNQVYNALFFVNNGTVERLCDDRAISVEDLFSQLDKVDKRVVLVGDGAQLCYDQKKADSSIELAFPTKRFQTASSVALCAEKSINDNNVIDSSALMPTYLRPSQAERERLSKEKE
ncbi:MAG: tRNA (adenosine(37)-N6)-threonylcarbamoyltransferase complex dimerization subunit type 1 TsaB [Ruminococcaceae bacterium]|nr:tRNA (adenosine(37)-N6)-threonylcarbamoyltransferase complex dimerization subunit type 1 TsaB [Oscillospiraceae bacterium]